MKPIKEDVLIQERKKKIINALKKNNHTFGYSILAITFFLTWLLKIAGFQFPFISVLSTQLLLYLSLALVISAYFSFNDKINLSSIPPLIWLVYLSIQIRTRNLSRLRDITTGDWTLGPDLDPFFFLRWAEYIVEKGTLFTVDMMRYVPFGLDIHEDYILHPYLIAWFHKFAIFFGSGSVTQSAAIFPVFMFALTVIAFFLLAREIFKNSLGKRKAEIVALISSFFLIVLPPLLPRTIAGIPEKESAAFLFLFLSIYLFLAAWNSKEKTMPFFLAFLAGVSTAAMASIWGGYLFIFATIIPSVLISFILNNFTKSRAYSYTIWLSTTSAIMLLSTTRYTIKFLLSSPYIGSAIGVLLLIIIHEILLKIRFREKLSQYPKISELPSPIISLIVSAIVVLILSSLILGLSFIPSQISSIYNTLVQPAESRLIQTVAENRQPFFREWSNSFGPNLKNIPIFFWLFFVGSIYLFYNTIKIFTTKERIVLTSSYLYFLIATIFSRYSSSSVLNGSNKISSMFYFSGILVLLWVIGFYYLKYYKSSRQDILKQIDIGHIILFSFFTLGIVGARSAVRAVMVLVPPTSIIVAYFIFDLIDKSLKNKDNFKITFSILTLIILFLTIFSGSQFYLISEGTANSYVPSSYTQQWQRAMFWVRENTQESAVFAHWWDYGYWIQSIGKRATVLDGGNAISYWNHLMGRHVLTGPNDKDALEFLYAHNVTHLLIDPTDIGKYPAFSTIGSDVNYDRQSFIPTLAKDNSRTVQGKNTTTQVYNAGFALDQDTLYQINGSQVFFPAGRAAIVAIITQRDKENNLVSAPKALLFYKNKQYDVPLKYAYDKDKLIEFEEGIDAGVFIFPSLDSSGANLDERGAILYLSPRVVNSRLARLYLFEEDNPNFKLANSEENIVILQIRNQYPELGSEFVSFRGFNGPIKIWEINYPKEIKFNPNFLNTTYPNELKLATR
jgi:dolichyl-diphosphooligosaccharide---protein glycosyltransferase